MKKMITLLYIVFLFLLPSSPVSAAPTTEELNEYAQSIGWTYDELHNYLTLKEITINDYKSIEDLKVQLGTPLTPDNLHTLLQKYHITIEELETLLAGFNEKIQDYWFMEELEVSIDFYQNHEDVMLQLDRFLVNLDINEVEKHTLLTHFKELDLKVLNEQLPVWKKKIDLFNLKNQESSLTKENQLQLLAIWKSITDQLDLVPVFYSFDDNGNRTELNIEKFLNNHSFDTVTLEVYNDHKTLILDTVLTNEAFSSVFAINAADKVVNMVELSSELSTLYESQLPSTASSTALFLFLGYILILIGIILLLGKKSRKVYDK